MSLLCIYRQILFHESNLALLVSARETIRNIRNKGMDAQDKTKLIELMQKQCTMIQTPKLRMKLKSQIKLIQASVLSEDSSASSSSTSSSDSSSSDTKYKVRRIMGFRLNSDNSRSYLVRWDGYESDDDSWEPIEQLMEDQCGDLIVKFHREHMRFR